jgi:CDP-ribitol ribitolphosphotransferase
MVQATGLGRTDLILDYHTDQSQIRKKLNIPSDKKVILFAPTWKQDKKNRSEIPFNLSQEEFFDNLENFAVTNNAFFIIRYHLNSIQNDTAGSRNMVYLPLQEYPNGEKLIAISDVLITDWSSIAFDMMVLDKPIVFLDVPSPFKNGFSLPPDYRAGDLVSNIPELLESLAKCCSVQDESMNAHDKKYQRIKQLVYDNTTDGKSTSRYFDRLHKLLTN